MMTHRKSFAWLAAAAALPLAACTAAMDEEVLDDVPAAVAVGEPVDCIQTNRIQNTRVHNDRTIDFEMIDNTVYRNTLPNRCPGLGFEEGFIYETTIGRLCDLDTITVLRPGGIHGPTCGLGEFVPVNIVES